jgi:hypothetical protein
MSRHGRGAARAGQVLCADNAHPVRYGSAGLIRSGGPIGCARPGIELEQSTMTGARLVSKQPYHFALTLIADDVTGSSILTNY